MRFQSLELPCYHAIVGLPIGGTSNIQACWEILYVGELLDEVDFQVVPWYPVLMYLCFLVIIYRKNPVSHMVLEVCGKDFIYTVVLRLRVPD